MQYIIHVNAKVEIGQFNKKEGRQSIPFHFEVFVDASSAEEAETQAQWLIKNAKIVGEEVFVFKAPKEV